jgi:hypothetical protein
MHHDSVGNMFEVDRADNGNYFIAADYPASTGMHALTVVCVDSAGQFLWQTHRVPNIQSELNYARICALPGVGCLAATSVATDGTDISMNMISSSGDLLWQSSLNIRRADYVSKIMALPEGGFVLAGTSVNSDGNRVVFLAKYQMNVGSVELIQPGPFHWGFALHRSSGILNRFTLFPVPQGTTSWVSGRAAGVWTSIQVGDSIVFLTPVPTTQAETDSFWLSLPDDHCQIQWMVAAGGGDISLEHEGNLSLISSGPGNRGFRVRANVGRIGRVVLTEVPPGSYGWTTGLAATTWAAMPNGDGNNGDSVIFTASSPLADSSVDTLWVAASQNICEMNYSIGCNTDSVPLIGIYFDTLQYTGARLENGIEIRIHVVGETGVSGYSIERSLYDSDPFVTECEFSPVSNDPAPHDYSFIDHFFWYGARYLLMVRSLSGCEVAYLDRMLIVGQNVAAEPSRSGPVTSYSISVYPNPFNPATTLLFTLPKSGLTTIAVYDIAGRKVQTLADGMLEAGEHRLTFNGSSLPSGIYFARLQSGEFSASRKLLLLK